MIHNFNVIEKTKEMQKKYFDIFGKYHVYFLDEYGGHKLNPNISEIELENIDFTKWQLKKIGKTPLNVLGLRNLFHLILVEIK